MKNTTLMKFSKKTLKKEYILMYTYQKKKKKRKEVAMLRVLDVKLDKYTLLFILAQ